MRQNFLNKRQNKIKNKMFQSIDIYNSSSESESDSTDIRLSRRNLRDALNVLDLPEKRFVATFRVSKEIFKMLLEEVTPRLKVAYRNTHIPAHTKLSTFLSFLATGGYQSSIGNEYVSSMAKSQVSKIISELLVIFEEYLGPKWIKLDRSLEEESKTKESFYETGGIPGIVGCVDGTHVRIKAPGNETNHLYYNRKGYYSINVMLICDQNMVITYVDARHPGANHDAFVWDQSGANHFFKSCYENGKRNSWLLGDSGYKLLPYVMTPFRNPTGDREKKYNERHCKIRNIIERCNGLLKNRFRCIIGSRGLHYSPQKATSIINTCCILHNICLFYKNSWEPCSNEFPQVTNGDDDENVNVESEETEAKSIRADIVRNLI